MMMLGGIDHQQAENREFVARVQDHGIWKNAQGRRQEGDLQVAHPAAGRARQAAFPRALDIVKGESIGEGKINEINQKCPARPEC